MVEDGKVVVIVKDKVESIENVIIVLKDMMKKFLLFGMVNVI